MEMSIEMRIQKLDKLIEQMERVMETQDEVGAFKADKKIVLYNMEIFLNIAEHLNLTVKTTDVDDGWVRLSTRYKDFELHILIRKLEKQMYEDRINRMKGQEV